jgi:hypothetical protein
VSFIPVYSFLLRKRAESLIHNASILYQSSDKTPSLGTALALYKGELKQMEGCTPANCVYEAVVSNRVLATLHWAHYAELRSEIWAKNGKIETVVLDYRSSANIRHSVVSHVYIQDGTSPWFDLDPWEKSSPTDANGIVDVSPESLRNNMRTVLGFDTKCLTSHRGCTTIAELLPTVWEQMNDGTIRCKLQNYKGLIEAPKSWFDSL